MKNVVEGFRTAGTAVVAVVGCLTESPQKAPGMTPFPLRCRCR